MDDDQRHQQDDDTRRMFGQALWLKDNLPITPDEWALLNLLIFGDVPERPPTSHEFERARAHHTAIRQMVGASHRPPGANDPWHLADRGAEELEGTSDLFHDLLTRVPRWLAITCWSLVERQPSLVVEAAGIPTAAVHASD